MMKKLFYFLIASSFVLSCTTKPQYKIEGKINGLNSGSAVLSKIVDNKLVTVDSVEITNGQFVFKGSVEQPELHVIKLADTLDGIQIFLENANMNIQADADSINGFSITGSGLNTLFKSFNDEMLSYSMKYRSLYNEYVTANMNGNMQKVKEIEDGYSKVEEEQNEYMKKFVKENSNTVLAPYITLRQMTYRLEVAELEGLVNGFSAELNESNYVKTLKERIKEMKKVAIGQPFVDFTLNDTTGTPVSLSSYIGEKYVLLDFWASWCTPCRQENPNLVENYAKYKDKGFEIFGVSLDKKHDSWVKAINDDGITWPQVSDLKYWQSEAGKLYAVRSIPHNVLIGKDGVIIAKNLRGDDLGDKLAELFD